LKIIQRNKYGGGGASFHELKEKDGVTKYSIPNKKDLEQHEYRWNTTPC